MLITVFNKVSSLFYKLNNSFKISFKQRYIKGLCVEEIVVLYYGFHGLKMPICWKPIRFGLKIWILVSSDGFLFHVEPYSGYSTYLPHTGVGQSSDIVLGLIDEMHTREGNKTVMKTILVLFRIQYTL